MHRGTHNRCIHAIVQMTSTSHDTYACKQDTVGEIEAGCGETKRKVDAQVEGKVCILPSFVVELKKLLVSYRVELQRACRVLT